MAPKIKDKNKWKKYVEKSQAYQGEGGERETHTHTQKNGGIEEAA